MLMQAGQTLDAARQAAAYLLYSYANLRAAVSAFQAEYVIAAMIILTGVLPAFLLPFRRVQKDNASSATYMT
jgi:hypothetical protein